MEIPRQKVFKFTTKLPRGGMFSILDSVLVLGITYLEHILEVVDHFVFDVKRIPSGLPTSGLATWWAILRWAILSPISHQDCPP